MRALALGICAFGGGACATLASGRGGEGAWATSSDESPQALMQQLARVVVEVENAYVDPVDRRKLLTGAIKGMVAELDPHSSYMAPEEYRIFQSDTEGKFGGVGIEVDGRNEMLIVVAPIEGSPAERAGVKSGDRIVRVEDDDVQGQALEKVVKRMRGLPGSKVRLWVKRDGTRELIKFDLVREIIRVAAVTSKLLDGNVGYLRIKQFQDHTHDELLAAAVKLRKDAKGALASVVLDLRGNPGGLVDEASGVADEFMTHGVVFTTRHRGQILDEVSAGSGGAFGEVPTVVLVDEWSASASELLTGALQDNKRAVVVGAATFGKGSVQSILDMPGGAGLKLTTARYYTPAGRAIQAQGIEPDIVVETHSGDALPALKERDLEGALSSEGEARRTSGKVVDAGAPAIGDGGAPPLFTDVRKIPLDPSDGPDLALRVAYRIARSLVGRGTTVR